MNRFSLVFAATAVAALGSASTARAQNPVKFSVAPPAKVAPGGKVSVKISAEIEDGWHIYSLTQGAGGPTPTRISVAKGQPITLDGTATGSEFDSKFDSNFGIQVEFYEKAADFSVPLVVDTAAKLGQTPTQVSVRYQACNASMCLPAKTDKVAVALNVAKTGKTGKTK